MAILIRKWEHKKLQCRTQAFYTIKVIDKGNVFRQYNCIDEQSFHFVMKDYAHHKVIDSVNVLSKKELLT